MMEPAVVLHLLDLLVTADSPQTQSTQDAGKAPSESEAFLNQLEKKMHHVASLIEEDKNLSERFTRITLHYDTSSGGPHWKFVNLLLRLVLLLKNVIEDALDVFNKGKAQSESRAPPMSPDTLNFKQQRTLLTCVQFIVTLGMAPHLEEGVGLPVHLRSAFSHLLGCLETGELVSKSERDCQLKSCVRGLLLCVKSPTLGSFILSRHLGDLLAALFQICFSPNSKPETVAKTQCLHRTLMEECSDVKSVEAQEVEHPTDSVSVHASPATVVDLVKQRVNPKETSKPRETRGSGVSDAERSFYVKELHSLLERVYQPMLVRELFILQGAPGPQQRKHPASQAEKCQKAPLLKQAPSWMRRACGRALSEIIMKPKGVESLILGMLEIGLEEENAPSQTLDWRKFQVVGRVIASCPLQAGSVERYYSLVAPQVLELFHSSDKLLARKSLHVAVSIVEYMMIQQPKLTHTHILRPILQPLLQSLQDQDISPTPTPVVIVCEEDLTCCIEDLYKLCVSAASPQSHLVAILQPVIQTIFLLFCFTKTGVAPLRSLCQGVLETFLSRTEEAAAEVYLHTFIFPRYQNVIAGLDTRHMHEDLRFTPGPGGGIVITTRPAHEDFIENWELKCSCLVELLTKVKNEGLAARFFISMLKELTEIISREVDNKLSCQADVEESGILLQSERRRQEERDKVHSSLSVLSLLAAMCELLRPECFKSPSCILQFVQITLERGVKVLQNTDDASLGIFESETVTMAMGMLTALMGGGIEMSLEERLEMKKLLPILQTFADLHPDPEVKDMATDLRIAIATHGIIMLDKLADAAEKRKQKESAENTRIDIIEVEDVIRDKMAKAAEKESAENTRINITEIEDVIKDKKARIKVIDSVDATEEKDVRKGKEEVKDVIKDKKARIKVIDSVDATEEKDLRKGKEEVKDVLKDKKTRFKVIDSVDATVEKDLRKGKEEIKDDETAGGDQALDRCEFDLAMEELCDPLVPVRGHGLIRLRHLVEKRNGQTLARCDRLVEIFCENLDHPDTYIYLAAIEGLSALSKVKPELILPVLTQSYMQTGKKSPELRMKIGEVMMKACRGLGETLPAHRDILLMAVLSGAKDSDHLVRASAMSNLAEVCKLLRFSLGNVIQEVCWCTSCLVKSDPDVEVRRAAALTFKLLLQGLGKHTFKVLESEMKEIYHLLKFIMKTEKDDLVRIHVLQALEELDIITREFLFPKQSLTKKIQVLDPPDVW